MSQGLPSDSPKTIWRFFTPVNVSLALAGAVIVRTALGMVLQGVGGFDPIVKFETSVSDLSIPLQDQTVASRAIQLCARGEAAGIDFVDPGGSVEKTLQNLMAGKQIVEGPFSGSYFQLSLPDQQVHRMEKLLEVEDGRLKLREF